MPTAEFHEPAAGPIENCYGQNPRGIHERQAVTISRRSLNEVCDDRAVKNRLVKGQRDHLSNAISTLTAQMDTLASRFIEAVKMARLQAYGERPAAPTEPRPVVGWDQARQPLEPSIPGFLRESPEEFHGSLAKPRNITEKRTLADHLKKHKII